MRSWDKCDEENRMFNYKNLSDYEFENYAVT